MTKTIMPLGLLLLVVVGFIFIVMPIIYQPHAPDTHGAEAVMESRIFFEDCGRDKSMVEMKNITNNRYLYICFLTNAYDIMIQVLSECRESDCAREVTTIPQNSITKARKYVIQLLKKNDYQIVRKWNADNIPQWFIELVTEFVK